MRKRFAAVHESGCDAVDGSSTGTRVPWMWGAVKGPTIRRSQPCKRSRQFGLDIAKSVFQVHGIDAQGKVIVRSQLKRRYVWHSSRNCSPAWSVSKPAPPRIIGRANCRRLGIRCALCRRLTRTESEDFPSIVHENQIFVEIHWPAEGCDESRKNGG
jgi:hypothetical protein